MVPPISSPRVLAIHRAAETAAIRRGSSIRIRPFSGGITSSRARGVRVVFPEPGGACRTAEVPARTVSFIFGRILSMGNDFPSRTFFIGFIKAHLQMPGQVLGNGETRRRGDGEMGK